MMFGMNETTGPTGLELRWKGYAFVSQGTLIFLTGTPLSGKSTVARLISSLIDDCSLQQMDILRLVAQDIENRKPESERNPFVNYGSCDSYMVIGDGTYSPERLIAGFNAYSKAVSSYLDIVVPKLGVQNAQNMLFEGVQLTPSAVSRYLNNNNRLVIVTSDALTLSANRTKAFGNNTHLTDRYSTEKLLHLQEEIIKQGREIPEDKLRYVSNTGSYETTVSQIVRYLFDSHVIERKSLHIPTA